jgi:uncharacterized protein YcaQ
VAVPAADLSANAARRIALAAQGFGQPRPAGAITARHLRKVVDTMGLLQLDSVNVLIRSHYLPVFARLGPYPREILDRLTAHTSGRLQREYVEYWAHEASLIPLETHPLLRWRMARAHDQAWGNVQRIAREQPQLMADVRRMVAEKGPIRSADLGLERQPKQPGQMWNWHDGKVALEYLFWAGEIGAARRINFERQYDLIERVLPAEIYRRPTPSRQDAQRELVRIAARSYGVATEPDLGDYFRLPRADSKQRVAELVEAGELVAVTVAGWNAPAYLWPAARRPRRIQARALLSPFDPLIWFPGRPAGARLLRSAVSARRDFGGSSRSEVRPAGEGAAGPVGLGRAGRRARRGGRAAGSPAPGACGLAGPGRGGADRTGRSGSGAGRVAVTPSAARRLRQVASSNKPGSK